MRLILAVGTGSFIGGVFRYLLSLMIQARAAAHFPLHTLAVNVTGCFLIGIVFGLFDKGQMPEGWRLFLATGVLGGFTAFSAFSHETLALLRDGHSSHALLYVLTSVTLGLLATYVAYVLVK